MMIASSLISGRHYLGVGVANTFILMMTLTILVFHLNAN